MQKAGIPHLVARQIIPAVPLVGNARQPRFELVGKAREVMCLKQVAQCFPS